MATAKKTAPKQNTEKLKNLRDQGPIGGKLDNKRPPAKVKKG